MSTDVTKAAAILRRMGSRFDRGLIMRFARIRDAATGTERARIDGLAAGIPAMASDPDDATWLREVARVDGPSAEDWANAIAEAKVMVALNRPSREAFDSQLAGSQP